MESEKTNYIEVTLDETVLKQLGYDVEYEEDWIRNLQLISFKKNGEDVKDLVIPSTYTYKDKNYKITKIGKCAFNYCKSLISVIIPDTITIIGESAFSDCLSLMSLEIPDSVIKIDDWAFAGCSSLKSVTIPNNITDISEGIFSDCSLLISVTIPDGVTKIGESAFSDCSSLTSIVIPNSVTEIGKEAFANCLSLTSLEIPDSVIKIGDWAFADVDTVYYNGNAKNSTWGANKVINNNYDYVEVALNETVFKQIGYEVKYEREHRYKKLVCFKKNGQDVISFDIPATYSYNGKDYKITQIGKYAFYDYALLEDITIPSSVTHIGCDAFSDCSSLKNVKLSDSIVKLGDSAFDSCESLTDIKLPNSLKEIDDLVFCYCSSLTSITIPNSVTHIGSAVFCYCSSLTNIVIPNSVTEIGIEAFANCSSLRDINIPNSITEIRDNIFQNCSSLVNINIPDSITYIGESAFTDCSSLTNIELPNNLKEIDKLAFYRCSSLESLTIPDGVIEIGDNAFYKIDTVYYNGSATGSTWGANKVINNNYDYVEVTLNETVLKQLGYDVEYKEDEKGELDYYGDVFKYLVSFKKNGQELISFDVPATYIYNGKKYKITQIEKCAFDSCESLKSVVIPDSVDYIGDWAFNEIPHIEYHGTATGAPWGAKSMN